MPQVTQHTKPLLRVLRIHKSIPLCDIGALLMNARIARVQPVKKTAEKGAFSDGIFEIVEWRSSAAQAHFETKRNFKFMYNFPQFWKVIAQENE